MRAPRLAKLAEVINADGRFVATIEAGYCNTDRHPKGVRWRIPGKGRRGNKLVVKNKSGETVFTHNAAETYRHNSEVVRWMDEVGVKADPKWPRYSY